MPLTKQGQNSQAGATVTIPAHTAGDLIVIAAYRDGSTAVPTKPTASGTVPAWVDITAAAGANTNSLRTACFVATASNHTSGTWTNATGMAAIVFRGQKVGTGIASIGGKAQTGGTQNGGSTTPAITPTATDGTSIQLHIHCHRTVTAWNAAPTGFTRVTAVATELAINTKDDTSTGTGVSQTGTTTSSGYRGEQIEILAEPVKQGAGSVSAVASLSAIGVTSKSGAGSVSAVASLVGVGQAPVIQTSEGFGSVTGVASLSAQGTTTRQGSGTVAGIAALTAVGRTVKSGSASISAIASLAASGTTTKSGAGTVSALAGLSSVGYVQRSGSSSIVGIASLTGVGSQPSVGGASGAGTISAIAFMNAVGSTVHSGSGTVTVVAKLRGKGHGTAPPPLPPTANGTARGQSRLGNSSIVGR
jgi:hypothetical protein